MESEMIRIEKDLSAHGEQIKTLFRRMERQDELIDAVNNLAISLRALASAQGCIKDRMDRLCDDVDAIKARPAKRWEGVVEKAVAALVGGVIAWLLVQAGLR